MPLEHKGPIDGKPEVSSGRLFVARFKEVSESQIDRDAALFFFLQAVGILAGQGFNQAGLSVIDMSGGADDVGHVLILDFRTSKLQTQNPKLQSLWVNPPRLAA